jgi:replicative DNA helicase
MSDNLIDVERAVIRVLLNDAEALVAVSEVLPEARFFATQRCAQVYQAMFELARVQVLPNVATVAEHLHVPLAQVQELATGYSSKDAREVVYLAELVAREGQRRLLLEALREATEMASAPTEDVVGLAYTAMQMVAGTSSELGAKRDTSIGSALDEVDDLMARAEANEGLIGYKTHMEWFNAVTYGLSRNNVWIVSGPSGGRKTTLALNLVIDALRGGAHVSYFALEGSSGMVGAGLWAMLATERLLKWRMPEEAHLSSKFLLLGLRSEMQRAALDEARHELAGWQERLYIYDGRDGIYNPNGIALKVQRDRLLHGTDVMVVDYLQLLGAPGLKDYEILRAAAQSMQRLIRELDICGILLAQLNESAVYELGTEAGYYSSGVKGGGDAQQVADYLFRVYPKKDDPKEMLVECRKARFARSHTKQSFTLNEQSGWVIGPTP